MSRNFAGVCLREVGRELSSIRRRASARDHRKCQKATYGAWNYRKLHHYTKSSSERTAPTRQKARSAPSFHSRPSVRDTRTQNSEPMIYRDITRCSSEQPPCRSRMHRTDPRAPGYWSAHTDWPSSTVGFGKLSRLRAVIGLKPSCVR